MSHVFYRQPKQAYPIAVRGEGIEIIDRDGKRYLDASGGAAVSCLGHSHPRVIAAIQAQAARLAYAHSSFFTSEPAEALADHLIERAPAGIDRIYYTSGGSEAVEAALKMVRQYFVEIGRSGGASSPGGRAITATRSAPWPSAATPRGDASSSRS
jgi:adenosylmethionine-8-amino-7-oxononanoate aminotransferase